MAFALRPELHACVANGRVVLLDLAADRYLALPSETDAVMQDWLAGKAVDPATLAGLMHTGLIVQTPYETEVQAKTVADAHFSRLSAETMRPSVLAPMMPVLAQLRTRRDLKRGSLNGIITDIRQEKARHACQSRLMRSDKLSRLIACYLASRRYIWVQDQCLRWSIAMVRYLRTHGYYPDLVLGVRMMPFAAHAWVQDGDTVLNDTVEQVSAFTPILVV